MSVIEETLKYVPVRFVSEVNQKLCRPSTCMHSK